jgi:hypothetical protein
MYLTFVRPIIPCFEAAYGAFPGALKSKKQQQKV